MALYKLLLHNPLLACSVCLCLLAIIAAIRLVRRLRRGPERFIAGFVGLVAIYEGLRILMEVGIWTPAVALGWTSFATLVVTGLFVLALVVVQELGSEGHRTRFLLRLLEAERTVCPTAGNHEGTESSAANTTTGPPTAKKDGIVIAGAAGANAV
jgi:hypothetical protein